MAKRALVRGGITVKPHVQRFADACMAATGADSYGTYPGHSEPEGPTQALDIFNRDSPVGYALQDRIVEFAQANAVRFGVRYIIRREHIWNIERAGEGWRRQRHYGNRTKDHYDHVHITFYARPGAEPEADSGGTPTPKEDQVFSRSAAPTVHLAARHSKLLITAEGGRHGAGIVTRPADGSLAQRWALVGHDDGTVSLVCRAGELCLDRPDNASEPGTPLQLAERVFVPAQRWTVEQVERNVARLWVPGVEAVLDVAGAGDDGARVILWEAKRNGEDVLNQQVILLPTV